MKFHLTITVAISILLSSCVSYYANPPIPVPELMPYSYRDSELDVYADPYLQFDRQWRYFGANLTAWRVIAIQVFVRNKSALSFALQHTWLELANGVQISRTPSRDFYHEKAWSEFGSIFGGWRHEYSKRQNRFWASELDDVVLNKDNSVHGFYLLCNPA